MAIERYMTDDVIVMRREEISRELGTPKFGEVKKWEGKGRASKMSAYANQQDVPVAGKAVFNLFLPITADVLIGDVYVINGRRFSGEEPYKPMRHHTQVVVSAEVEA